MIQVRLDTTGSYAVRLPKAKQWAAVTALAQKFVAYDQTRPEAERNPVTAKLEALLAQALPCADDRLCSERRRMVASEAVKRLDGEARQLVSRMWYMMNSIFKETPEQAEAWGFKVKQGNGRIQQPQTRAGRLALLSHYLAAEERRPEGERFIFPDLAEVRRVRDELAANLSARDAGETQREVSHFAGQALARQLYNYLQVGLVELLSEVYDFNVTPDLQKWGFDVVVRNGHGNSHTNGNDNGAVG
jgi:hypothetical protein